VTLMTGTNGEAVTYAHPTGSVKRIIELGQGEERRLESEFAYDRYGNETTNADYGIVVDGDRSAFDDERITTTEYAINTNVWILRLPSRQEIQDEHGVVISRVESFYDDETFSGTNLGQVTIGNLTLKREWIDAADRTNFVASTRIQYDAYGNPRSTLDPLAAAPAGVPDFTRGHGRSLEYDSGFHTSPVRETIHVGAGSDPLLYEADYDEGFGILTRSLDFNGHTTTYVLDALARLIQIIRPGDTPSFPSSEFEYALAVPLGGGRLVNYVVTRQLDREPQSAGPDKRSHYFISRQFTDGMGRALMARAEAEPAVEGGPPRVVVSGATRFNARRTAARALNPFFTTVNSENLDDLLTFESIEAADWKGLFEENGTLVELDLASAHQAATRYDATLRPIETENPDGTRKRTSYEPLLTKFFDENDSDPASQHSNTPTLHHNDGLGRLVRLGEITRLDDAGVPGGTLSAWTTRYEYDLHDQLVRATDSQGNVKWMTYDGLKRKTFINDPDRGVAQFSYDAGSNLRESLDAKGQRITITYDGLNRPEAEDLHDEASSEFSYGRSPDVIYHYDRPAPELDQGDNTRAEAENVKGRLAWVEDVSGEEHSSYDARNRVTWTVKRIRDPRPDSNTLVSYRTGFAYDVADRLTQVTYPDNDAVRYEYNERGLLRRIAGGPNALVLSNLSYWASGRPGEIHYGSGVRSHYQHDPRLRLKELGTRNSELGTELVHYGYDFDSASNIKSIADLRPGSAVQEGHPRRNTQLFQYDDLHRLTRVQYSFHLPGQTERNDGEITYRYDRIGNMLAQTSTLDHREKGLPLANLGEMDSGGALGRWNRLGRATNAPPGPHALTSIRNPQSAIRNYSYDANGSMTVIDGLTNTWDFKDRLVTVESAEMRAEYAYDHTGRRIIKRVAWKPGYPLPSDGRGAGGEGGVTTVSYVNKYFEVSEHDAPVKYVWNGSVRIARVTGSLSDNPRLQRLRVYPGWNLVSLAVTATNALEQLMATPREPGFTLQAFRWEPATQSWIPVEARETLPAGSVCWLKVSKNATLSILGPYPGPPVQPRAPPGGDFLPGAGFEVWSPAWPDTVQLWRFDASTQQWHSKGTAPLADSPSDAWTVAPGEAVFVRAPEIIELALPDPRLNVRYYHPDHLGSAAAISDADGRLVEETAFYPFGHPRHEWRPQGTEEPYQFAQKERDRESDLQYFEARYHSGVLARFTRADPLVLNMPGAWLASPQEQNLYAFARNNPLKFIDPTGLKITVAGSWYGEGYRYRQDVAEALRRLDPSARVSRWTGEVSFGAKPNPLLPRSRELLTRLVTSRQTVMIGRTSASLVDLATSSDQRAGLEQYDYNASGAQAGPSKTGAMVLWQAGDRNWGITVGPEGGRGRQLFQETTSGFIALAHELIHAGHQIDGGMSSAIKDKQERYQGIKWDVSAEELRTVGLKDVQNQSYAGQRDITENMIRAEHGHTRRAVYGLH
jgi:RHS repeat-associated protein